MTHVFPYINTVIGFFVWLLLILNAIALFTLIYKVVRWSDVDGRYIALVAEAVIAFNLAVSAFLLFHPSLLEPVRAASGWSTFFSVLSWYLIMKFVLYINFGMTAYLLFYVSTFFESLE